jgi:hypothetical protein
VMERGDRECARCGRTFRVRYAKHRFCSQFCGSRGSARRRGPRPERRKVRRPSQEQLNRDVEALGYAGTGRKYGVSENAVRKWVRWYRDSTHTPEPS